MVVGLEDFGEDLIGAGHLGAVGFGGHAVPQLVVLSETRLDYVRREAVVDVGLVAAAVAGVNADGFAEEMLDCWDEGVVHRQVEAGEGDVGRFETAAERRSVVRLRRWDLLYGKFMTPEVICDLGLGDTGRCEMGVGPYSRSISIQLSPIALQGVNTA